MARPLRIQLEGGIFYVTFTGSEGRKLFRKEADYLRFLDKMASQLEIRDAQLLAYSLLPTRAKLLLQTPKGNISRFVAGLLTGYANHLQHEYNWTGPITQGRYKSRVVEPGAYVLQLSRWIHLSPVWEEQWRKKPIGQRRAELKRYRWSSYADYIGKKAGPVPVDVNPVLRQVKARLPDRRQKYALYVEAALSEPDADLADAMYRAPLGIGSPEFVKSLKHGVARQASSTVQKKTAKSRKSLTLKRQKEVIAAAEEYFGLPLRELRRRRRNSIKPVIAALLTRHAGLTQTETAKVLGVGSGAAICVQLRRLHGEKDTERRRHLDRLERRLKR